jgi:hypothetical protein
VAVSKINPSGYVESQGDFAIRFAREISKRTGFECLLELEEQVVFEEPVFRTNFDVGHRIMDNWNESEAWDELAEYYLSTYSASTNATHP